MTKHEKLMAEYDDLYIEERKMINEGLYADGCIWINEKMPSNKKLAILAKKSDTTRPVPVTSLIRTLSTTGNRNLPPANGLMKKSLH